MPGLTWEKALVAATAAHAGFQLTVSTVVYPALGRVPPSAWAAAHTQHARRITPVVALVYGAVLVASAGRLATRPVGPALVSFAASAGALATTAFEAGPLHGRLSAGRDPELFGRLVRADRRRTAFALTALASALAQPLVH